MVVERAALHEHLDGCLLPGTLLELSGKMGFSLGVDDDASLEGFLRKAARGSLQEYLSVFKATTRVLRDEDSLERVAYEHVEQMLEDDVVVGEIRFAPSLVGGGRARMERSIEAVWRGMERGMRGTGMRGGVVVCAMRDDSVSEAEEVARAAVRMSGAVVGFDLAGAERGWRASRLKGAVEVAVAGGLGVTVHAGEADGVEAVRDALLVGAMRVGHGVSLRDDIRYENGEAVLGEVAADIVHRRIPVEVCISSNIHTRAVESLEEHPVLDFVRAGVRVTLQTDNRLVSMTTIREEEARAKEVGLSEEEIAACREVGVQASFVGC